MIVNTKKKRIAAYFRMSTEQQSNSIARQRLAFRTFLKNNDEYEKDSPEYVESGVSGDASTKRPVQLQLLAEIESGKLQIDELFVSDPSRWGRFQTMEKAKFVLPLKVAGIKLRTYSTLTDFEDPQSDLMYDISQNLSYIENHSRSQRVVSGIATKVKSKSLNLQPCYGLKREGKRLVINPDEAEIVRLIFHKYIECGSIYGVVGFLNKQLRIASPKGKLWRNTTVRDLLINPKVAGYYCYGRHSSGKIHVYDGTPLPKQRSEKEKGKHCLSQNFFSEYSPDLVEPVIDLDTWARVQQLLVERTTPLIKKQDWNLKFRKLVYCSCGRRMGARRKDDGAYLYYCQSGRANGCHSGAVHEQTITKAVADGLKNIILADDAEVKIEKLLKEQQRKGSKDFKRMKELQEKYETATKRLMDLDTLLPANFKQQLKALKIELDALQAKLRRKQLSGKNIKEKAKLLAEGFKEALAGVLPEQALSDTEMVKKMVSHIHIQYVFQRHGEKVFSAPQTITTTYCLWDHCTEATSEVAQRVYRLSSWLHSHATGSKNPRPAFQPISSPHPRACKPPAVIRAFSTGCVTPWEPNTSPLSWGTCPTVKSRPFPGMGPSNSVAATLRHEETRTPPGNRISL